MFIMFTSRKSECFLLNDCNIANSTTCSKTPDCSLVVTGPKAPPMQETCCDQFEEVTCERESEIDHFYEIEEPSECQSLCRDTIGCLYWSLYVHICFLYSVCRSPVSCSTVCTSGLVFPDISSCEETKDIFDTLVMGGQTVSEGPSISVELITTNRTCVPQMDHLPVARSEATAAVFGSKIFFCGGDDYQYRRTCHSFDLDEGEGGGTTGGWVEEASLVFERESFGLSAIGNILIASGGYQSEGPLSSVEVFREGKPWTLETKLEMGETKYHHCSLALGSWLYTIGGLVGGTSTSSVSNKVEAIDTGLLSTDDSMIWVKKANMREKRQRHGCLVGVFEGKEGIYVAGGFDSSTVALSSTEFYNPAADMWKTIGSLNSGRASPMSMLGGQLIVSGGEPGYLTSVEAWNGSRWVEIENLEAGRRNHMAVSIKAGKLSCAGN